MVPGRHKTTPTIVVDFSRGSIKLAAAEPAGEAARFRGITQVRLPHPAEEGAQQSDVQLAEHIHAAVLERGWLGMRAACLLSRSATSTQSFLFPPMPDGELRQAIELKLGETLHFDVQDACFDFRRVAKRSAGGGEQDLTLVVAARKDSVQRALDVLRRAGLKPSIVGAASESLANLIYCARLCGDAEATVHVDIGADSTILNLFEGRLLRFSREVDIAGESFTRSLMRPILTADGAVHLTREQAEDVKIVAGYPAEDQDLPLPHGVRSSEILPLMEPVAQQLTTEIRRSADYLRGILDRPVDRILLTGSAAEMRNLGAVLEETLATPVSRTDPVERATAHWRLAVCDDDPPSLTDFAAILGFSLGNHRPVNLLPREFRIEETLERVGAFRKVAVPCGLAFAASVSAAAVPIDRAYGAALREMQAASAALQRLAQDEAALDVRLQGAWQASDQVAAARGIVPDWPGIVKELAAILPEAVQITSLASTREDGVTTLRFFARVHVDLDPFEGVMAATTEALGTSPFFSNLQLHDASAPPGKSGRFEASLELVAAVDNPARSQP